MHKYLDEYDSAPPDRVAEAMELFPYKEMSAEEYAARESHNWICFGFDNFIYEDSELNEWIHTLGDIFFTPGAIKDAREKHLSTDEIAEIERVEKEPL